jgi:hypothetical protein
MVLPPFLLPGQLGRDFCQDHVCPHIPALYDIHRITLEDNRPSLPGAVTDYGGRGVARIP